MKQLCEIARVLRLKATEACVLCDEIEGQVVPLNIKDQLLELAEEIQSTVAKIPGEINARKNAELKAADVRALKQAI